MGADGFDEFWRARFADELATGRTLEQVLADAEMMVLRDAVGRVDLSLCARMPNLRELIIALPDAEVVGKEAIPAVPKLRELVVSGGSFSQDDLSTIAASPSLSRLQLNEMALTSLSPLAASPALQELALHRVTGLRAEAVLELPGLTSLRVSESDLGDLGLLAELPRLRSLDLEQVPLADLSFLAAPRLLSFTCDARAADESALALLADRGRLTTFDYPVGDPGALAGCSRLTSLRVDGSGPVDLTVLAALPVTSIEVWFAPDRATARQVCAHAREVWPGLESYGYRAVAPATAGALNETTAHGAGTTHEPAAPEPTSDATTTRPAARGLLGRLLRRDR